MLNEAALSIETPVKAIGEPLLRLMLGGRDQRLQGWTNVDLHEGPNVDVKADVSKLPFADQIASDLYCSHILEHFPHPKTLSVLKEWRRVLKRGGKAYISVPDFDSVLRLANKTGFCPWIRNYLYGDQIYDLAFHYNCFTFASLAALCVEAGFSDVKRLPEMPFGLMDCSHNFDTVTNESVSVNIEAIN